MLYAVVRDGQIVEVCWYFPSTSDGETVVPRREAIQLGIPYA